MGKKWEAKILSYMMFDQSHWSCCSVAGGGILVMGRAAVELVSQLEGDARLQ